MRPFEDWGHCVGFLIAEWVELIQRQKDHDKIRISGLCFSAGFVSQQQPNAYNNQDDGPPVSRQ